MMRCENSKISGNVFVWSQICIVLLSFNTIVLSKSLKPRLSDDLCSITDARTAIVDDRLFVMSANYTYDDGEPGRSEPYIYWLNLNTSFSVDGFIPQSMLHKAASPTDELLGTFDQGGTFFYDHSMLYAYAGITNVTEDSVSKSLWGFNTTTNKWNLTAIQGGSIQFNNNSEGEHASDPATGKSFYTGGFGIGVNGTYNGIVEFDAYNAPGPLWTFHTKGPTGIDTPSVLKGGMEYVRLGQSGVLILFGGFDSSHVGVQFAPGDGWDWDYRPMSTIFVYDIYSNSFYNVTATGDIPSERSEFCTAVSSSPDDSSFQITVHGGWNQLTHESFNSVHVLTIPSFRWIEIDDENNKDRFIYSGVGRTRLRCNVWNDGQMIVTGGSVGTNQPGLPSKLNTRCNSTYAPFKVLNTSTYVWQTEFIPNKNYAVPDAVYKIIGGSASGGATAKSPLRGWSNTDLQSILAQTVTRDTFLPNTTPSSTSTSISSPTPPGIPSQSNTGRKSPPSPATIAGAVIGSAVAVLILLIVSYIFFRSLRRKRANPNTTDKSDSITPELPNESLSPPAELSTHEPMRINELHGRNRIEMDGGWRGHEV